MHNETMVPYGKAFTDPLFVVITISLVSLLFARRRTRKVARARLAVNIALLSIFGLAVISTDAAVRALERTLAIERESGVPEIIIVPSGGSSTEVLETATAERVHAAVEWWELHRRTRLVMSGADTLPHGQSSPRTVRLMRRMAILYGVPAKQIVMESRSRNTREHPREVLRIPGVDRSTVVGVVTSATHARRTRTEFRRHFDNVISHPVVEQHLPLYGASFVPSSGSLENATSVVHEWVGTAWYALTS